MVKSILIINGPNLNLLGTREPAIYGNISFEDYLNTALQTKNAIITYYQSNIEGEIINTLQQAKADAIILNAGAYTHTSIAIADCLKAIAIPVIEVHISNIYAREVERHTNLLRANCIGSITGLGLQGYDLAITYCINYL